MELEANLVDNPSLADKIAEDAERHRDAINYNLNNRCSYGWANILGSAISKARLVEKAERRTGKPVRESIRKKLVLTQDELMEKAYPSVTISSLYRRYNQVYLMGLEEAVLTLLDCSSIEEAHERITARIEKVGTVQNSSIKKFHSMLKTNIPVGED